MQYSNSFELGSCGTSGAPGKAYEILSQANQNTSPVRDGQLSVLQTTCSCKCSVIKRGERTADCPAACEHHSPINVSRSPDSRQLLHRMATARAVLSFTFGFFLLLTEF